MRTWKAPTVLGLLLAVIVQILAACGGPPTYTVMAKYGYSLPNVPETIQFSIYRSDEEPDSSGRIISQDVSLEQAKADLVGAVKQAMPEGMKGVQLIIPADLHLKETDLPGCLVETTQEHPDYGVLECDGIPTGTRYVLVSGGTIRNVNGQNVYAAMLTIMPYNPVMPANMGMFFHTRHEAEEHAAYLVTYTFATHHKTGLEDPIIFYMGDPPIKITGCSIKKEDPNKGLITCKEQQQA